MARQEGFYVQGTRAARNHNPGNLEDGAFARAHGAIGTDGRFAVFPTDEAGFRAMRALLQCRYRGMTVAQMLAKYAPPVENRTDVYLAHVCQWTGLAPDTLIDAHLV